MPVGRHGEIDGGALPVGPLQLPAVLGLILRVERAEADLEPAEVVLLGEAGVTWK